MTQRILVFVWMVLLAGPTGAGEFLLKDADRVLFLGDSNTYADRYIQYLDAYLFTRFPDQRFELINRGMPSETVAGTSERTHVPPRPDLHTRFSRTAPPLKPDLIFACYGMNDGVYLAPNEEVFAKYRAGTERLVERVRHETTAGLILLTPPPFDALPFAGKPVIDPPDYRRPDPAYDQTLDQFARWLKEFGEREKVPVVELHTAISELLAARRRNEPDYLLAGDGIHFNETGHLLVALEILKALNAPASISTIEFEVGVRETQVELPLPMPRDGKWDQRLVELSDFQRRVNQLPFQAKLPEEGRYQIAMNGVKGPIHTSDELAEGIDLGKFFERIAQPAAAQVLSLVSRRRQLLLELWVKNDPHPRLAGMHKDSRATLDQVKELETRIRELCQPLAYSITLVPAAP